MSGRSIRSARYKLARNLEVQFFLEADGSIAAVWDPQVPDREVFGKCGLAYRRALMSFLMQRHESPMVVVL